MIVIKLLIGGSPCTRWSIAQTKNRETEPTGIGWELFENYLIALDKFHPDFFLYENNKSMSVSIRAEITRRFGFEPICINSALVSAQNRQRLYWCGKRNPDGTYSKVNVEQPEDRGILLRDILETGLAWQEKAYCLAANRGGHCLQHDLIYKKNNYAAEPILESKTLINVNPSGHGMNGRVLSIDAKSYNLTTNKGEGPKIMEPVRIGTIESTAKNADFDSQQYRVYSPDGKSVTLCGQGGRVGAKIGLYAVPCAGRMVGRRINESGHRDDYNTDIPHVQRFEINENPQKTNCLTTVQKDNVVAEPVEAYCLRYERTEEAKRLRKAYEAGEIKHGYHEYHELHPRMGGKTNTLTTVQKDNQIIEKVERYDLLGKPIYEVRNGLISINGKQYPIKLTDGFYIIRKLTVTECKRLQTVPDSYVFPVSNSQAYKMLGNGWTVDVISHILSHCQDITSEELDVLSMYDGMACGHIALDKLGAHINRYRATEIDKYSINTACHNFPDIEQLGDAFQVRNKDWI